FMTPYILLILGLLFVWLEFYLPGGALAVAAAIFVLAALATFFSQSSTIIASIIFFILCITSVILVVRLAIYRIKKSAKNNTFFLSTDQEGFTAQDVDAEVIGKTGTTVTECGPSGFALIAGRRLPVVAKGSYLGKGVEVEVIAKELGHYVVISKQRTH